jgi:hypothetical protein
MSSHNAIVTIAVRAPLSTMRVPTVQPIDREALVHVEWTASTPLKLHQTDGGLLVKHPFVMGSNLASVLNDLIWFDLIWFYRPNQIKSSKIGTNQIKSKSNHNYLITIMICITWRIIIIYIFICLLIRSFIIRAISIKSQITSLQLRALKIRGVSRSTWSKRRSKLEQVTDWLKLSLIRYKTLGNTPDLLHFKSRD